MEELISGLFSAIGASLSLIVGLILLVVLGKGAVFTVKQQTAVVVQRLGKFHTVRHAGLNFKIPIIDLVAGSMTLKVQQHNVPVETITKDKVSVGLKISVQYMVIRDRVYDAFYKLETPEEQLASYIFDVVRAEVPRIDLDQVFEQKEEIASAIKTTLTDIMTDFGYDIVNVLVTDIDPDQKVKAAMNAINEAQRMEKANKHKGEADKILLVKKAEAGKEAAVLEGQGIAGQRTAIIEGLKDSVDQFQQAIPGIEPESIMAAVLFLNYVDTLEKISNNPNTKVIYVPSGADSADTIRMSIVNSILAAKDVAIGS